MDKNVQEQLQNPKSKKFKSFMAAFMYDGTFNMEDHDEEEKIKGAKDAPPEEEE
jgi:hypothetical protein